MKPNKTLSEAHNYLVYVAEALESVSNQFNIDRNDKISLKKCAEDLYEYSKVVEQLKQRMEAKEQAKKKEIEEDEQTLDKKK